MISKLLFGFLRTQMTERQGRAMYYFAIWPWAWISQQTLPVCDVIWFIHNNYVITIISTHCLTLISPISSWLSISTLSISTLSISRKSKLSIKSKWLSWCWPDSHRNSGPETLSSFPCRDQAVALLCCKKCSF